MSQELQQQWLVRLGEGLGKKGETAAARKNFEESLAESMPQNSAPAQKARLSLGDMAFKEGKPDEARKWYENAATGPDSLLASLAGERLKQMSIDNSISTLNLPAGK